MKDSPDIFAGKRVENITFGKFSNTFPAFAHTNYRIWFIGQFVSLIGTWIQTIALGWFVFSLTHSAFWVGFIAMLGTLPIFIFSLFGGVLVDKFSKKRILFLAEGSSMILSFVMGILVLLSEATFIQIAVLSFLLGIVTSIDMPARLAFAIEMVGKKSLPSALALNAAMFNAARIIGPAIAGFLIIFFGVGWAFILNGLSFIPILISLYFIKAHYPIPHNNTHLLRSIVEGVHYAYNHSIIRDLLIFVGFTSIFGWSYAIVLPVVVEDVFHLGVTGLGYFNATAGIGAVIGTIIVSVYANKVNPFIFIFGGGIVFSLALILFSFVTLPLVALITLFFIGAGMVMQLATMNATIQQLVDDRYRGRIMSIYTFMFLGLSPIGSILIGFLSEQVGPEITLRIYGILILSYISLFLLARKKTDFSINKL